MIKTKLFAILAAVPLVACSIISPRNQEKLAQPEVRDVPFTARAEAPKKRVMVLPFIDGGNLRSQKTAQIARDAFIRSLRKTEEFVVVSNNDFPKDVTTYLKNGEYDLEAMGKLGSGLGLAAIIEGRIVEVKAKLIGDPIGLVRQVRARIDGTVGIRLVNTKNNSISLNEQKSASVEETTVRYLENPLGDRNLDEDPALIEAVITEAFKSTIPRIQQSVEKLSWEGRVALVKGDRIYLNAGRLSGIQIGDILKITEEGEDVYDPESGSLIGKVPGRLKGTVEVITYFGKDGAISIVHSGSGFRENDRVELY